MGTINSTPQDLELIPIKTPNKTRLRFLVMGHQKPVWGNVEIPPQVPGNVSYTNLTVVRTTSSKKETFIVQITATGEGVVRVVITMTSVYTEIVEKELLLGNSLWEPKRESFRIYDRFYLVKTIT